MTAGSNRELSRANRRRTVLKLSILLSLVAVSIFRIVMDRKHASDSVKYADSEEAVQHLTAILDRTPDDKKISISLSYINSESPAYRYAAVDSLEHARGPEIVDVLNKAFSDSSAEVRKRALDLMPKVNEQQGYLLELQALQDEDSWLKDHAAFLLSTESRQPNSYIDARAVPVLIRTIVDSDTNLAPLTIPILKKITGLSGHEWRFSVLDNAAKQQAVKSRWANWWSAHEAAWPAKGFEHAAAIVPSRSDPAPGFVVKDIENTRVDLESMRGKVVLLNFWGTWCPPCQQEMPDLAALDAKFRAEGLNIVGIAVKEKDADSLRTWCRQHNINYPQVLDADHIAHIYGDCYEVPVSILIDRKGRIRRRWEGERDYDTFRLAVQRLLQE